MDYLKRVGDRKYWEEMSIVLPIEAFEALVKEANWCLKTKRNELGIACAVMWALRDSGMVVRRSDIDPRDNAVDALRALVDHLAQEGYVGPEIDAAKKSLAYV